jgi:hypothetical protein
MLLCQSQLRHTGRLAAGKFTRVIRTSEGWKRLCRSPLPAILIESDDDSRQALGEALLYT